MRDNWAVLVIAFTTFRQINSRGPDMNQETLQTALPLMQQLLWSSHEERRTLEANGLTLVPANFYANIPSVSEIDSSFEYTEPVPPYLDCGLFDEQRLGDALTALLPHTHGFNPPTEGDSETCRTYFWNNSQFSGADAMAYFAHIKQHQPQRVVEIGSGFSTLVAHEALSQIGSGQLTCIEPFPRPFISAMAADGQIDHWPTRAQDVTGEQLNSLLSDGDILFIDSTHTVKTGSDCLHIYLRLLPKIKRKILVHVHDVFLPYGMPKSWVKDLHIHWTEQYLLLAFLLDNPKVKVMFGSYYGYLHLHDLMEQFMRGLSRTSGGSFWFEYDGSLGI